MSAAATLDQPAPHLIAPALELRGVVKRFGGVAAVDGVDLELAAGEPLAVIGPNGAGKSTLLRLIAGELHPDEGDVLLAGRRHAGAPAHRIARRGVGLAHQVPLPFGRLTVRENVRVGALNRRHRLRGTRELADAALARCALLHLAERPASSLGLLDLKRLELARALSLEPSVLLLDEVAAGLAGPDLKAIIELVAGIRDEGVTVVIVEHVERVVRELVERVVVLDWGQVIARGTPSEIAADATVREVYLGSGSVGEPHAAGRPADHDRRSARGRAGLSLSLGAVTAGYGSVTALRDVELEVAPGETVAVLGANGAGKSTLARVISGLSPIRGGAITLDGEDITGMPAHARVELGIAHCQEGRRLFPGMTVAENLMLPTRSARAREGLTERRAWVQELFPVLQDRPAQEAQSLSGGQQQMVAIARALMANPRLVVFDEISLGLAPAAIGALYDAIGRIRSAGISILLVEQNVHRGLAFADRAYVLDRGRVTFVGDPSELMDGERLDAAYFGAADERLGSPSPWAAQ
jgi:branched-chain amino acid transport system ATP-binding protein